MKTCIVLAVAGVISVAAGTLLLWGAGVALMVAGGLGIVTAVVTYDPKSRQ